MSIQPANTEFGKIIGDAVGSDRLLDIPSEIVPDLSVDLNEYKLQDKVESLEVQNQKQNLELQGIKQQLSHRGDNHVLRFKYALYTFTLVAVWLACVGGCVLLSGFSLWGFKLSDSVLIAFITSTTINVVGLFVLVAKWMFPSGKQESEPLPVSLRN